MSYPTKKIYPIYFSKQGQKITFFTRVNNVPNRNQNGQVSYSYENEIFTYQISNVETSSPILYGHFHLRNGLDNPVIEPIADIQRLGVGQKFLPTVNGTWMIPEKYKKDFEEGKIYINIHTQEYPIGEIEAILDRRML